MIWLPELGTMSLIIAFWLCVCGLLSEKPKVSAQGFCILFSFFCLAFLLWGCDFSVLYVANHSNTALPWYYRLSALWGAHEGSMLLWVLCLSCWIMAVSFNQTWERTFHNKVLRVLSGVQSLFIAFVVCTSNPFTRLLPFIPKEGGDLNPLLQDIGLIIHPPMLYVGYVGFVVPFAMVIALLWLGVEKTKHLPWAIWMKPYAAIALAFLSIGITLGSWWAYYELGWGGWWFWDPVENASLMPWLLGVALVHLLFNSICSQSYIRWIFLLSITTFGLCVMGTFLVRSGSITSVHAFATDPERGIFILAILGGLLSLGYGLYALKGEPFFEEDGREVISWKAKGILLSVILWSGACFTVVLGTLYPLIIDGLGLSALSVGAPYFEMTVLPWMLPLLILCAILPSLNWHKPVWIISFIIGIGFAVRVPGAYPLASGFGVGLGAYLLISTLITRRPKGSKIPWGMYFAHMGLSLIVLGAALSAHLSIEKELSLSPGESASVAHFEFRFDSLKEVESGNYKGVQAHISVLKNEHFFTVLYPEKRYFFARDMAMTETALNPSVWNELYVALSQPLEGEAWAFRIYWKPFVRLIWCGGILIALGLCCSVVLRKIRRMG